MTDIDKIREEIDRATERRAELWHLLSEGHDAELAAELHALEERLAALWDEQRLLKARVRFGDRDEIIKRARNEARLARAAYTSPLPERAAFSRGLTPLCTASNGGRLSSFLDVESLTGLPETFTVAP